MTVTLGTHRWVLYVLVNVKEFTVLVEYQKLHACIYGHEEWRGREKPGDDGTCFVYVFPY